MICENENCNVVLNVDQCERKIKYCSQYCRTQIYRKLKWRKEVKELFQSENPLLDNITVKKIKEAGFDVIIKEKEISNLVTSR